MAVLILSSHSDPRLAAPVNHQCYAGRHGYRYLFDATPYRLDSPYDQKLHAILTALEIMRDGDHLVWIDDDAYFMQLDRRLEEWLPAGVLAVCHSPVNPTGGWSKINSGVMLITVGDDARTLFRAALGTPFADVLAWWDEAVHGNVCIQGGDQERLLYQIDRLGFENRVTYHPAEAFNARIYQFGVRADEHFVCHAASHPDKPAFLHEVAERFPLDAYLLPPGVADAGANTSGLFSSTDGLVGRARLGEHPAGEGPVDASPTTEPAPPPPPPPPSGLVPRLLRALHWRAAVLRDRLVGPR